MGTSGMLGRATWNMELGVHENPDLGIWSERFKAKAVCQQYMQCGTYRVFFFEYGFLYKIICKK